MAGNASSGRRKPVALKLYQGNRGKIAKARLREVAFRPGAPECPDWLPQLAKDYWDHVVRELGHIPGLLQRTDLGVLERLCKRYAEWRLFTALCDKHGWMYKVQVPYAEGGEGEGHFMWKVRPEARFAKEAGIEFDRLRGELGLSPAHRSRLAIQNEVESKKGLLDSDGA